jgi:hypothetical protein
VLARSAASSGSFVGSVEGGRRGDLFMYRTFFDLEVRPGGCCAGAWRSADAAAARSLAAPQIKAEDGFVLHQVRNRQDAKFEFVMPKEVRAAATTQRSGRPCIIAVVAALCAATLTAAATRPATPQGRFAACIRNYGRHNTEARAGQGEHLQGAQRGRRRD